jgi:hypothetical protein
MTAGRNIRLFLVDGMPSGIITAEIMNWTGHVIVAPRSRLADLVKRPEAGRTGIYILTGPDPDGGFKPMVYIGETDNVGKRLAQHNKDEAKAFWEQTCIVTSKDQNLTKAHVRYLESQLIEIATSAGRSKFANGTAPEYGLLPEADLSDMEFFIDQLRVMLPVLGFELLKEQVKTAMSAVTSPTFPVAPPPSTSVFEIKSKKHDLHAEAREIDGEFVVLAGSEAQSKWIGAASHSYSGLFTELVETGVLVLDASGVNRFQTDYAFKSPSAASAVVLGRADNGRISWKVKGTEKSYAAWQEEQVAVAAPIGGEE